MVSDFSPAHHAVEMGDLETLRRLLDAGADVHEEHYGLSLLQHALDVAYAGDVEYGDTEINIVDLLLSRGADPTRRLEGGTGDSAEHMAVLAGDARTLEVFEAWTRERKS